LDFDFGNSGKGNFKKGLRANEFLGTQSPSYPFAPCMSDRDREAQQSFQKLTDRYERLYYSGIASERRAKTQLRTGQPPYTVLPLFEQAMRSFEEAE
jgi:hypothetical protein